MGKGETLFRGKLFNNNSWVYGGALIWNGKARIIQHIQCLNSIWTTKTHDVKIESVGQFTGLLNKDGSKIFSGKIRIDISGIGGGEAEIKMFEGKWQIFESSQGYLPLFNALERDNFIITQEQ